MSVHFTGKFARLRAGRICSCTRYVQRTSSRSGNSRMWSTTVCPPSPFGPGSQEHTCSDVPVGSAVRTIPGLRLRDRQTVQQRLQLLPLRRVNHVIGIEPERIIPGRPRQRRVPGRGEVIDPDEIKHPRPKLPGNLPRPIGRAGVNHHDLVEQATATDPKQADMFFSSSRTIIVSEIVALRAEDSRATDETRMEHGSDRESDASVWTTRSLADVAQPLSPRFPSV